MTLVWMFLGFLLLAIGGRFILRSAVAISLRFNISKLVIGMTVVAFATSSPELLVSLKAAFNGSPSIAMNNVIGSNIANIGLVLGLIALIGDIAVTKSFYKINWPVMTFFSLILYLFIKDDKLLSRNEGLFLISCLTLFLFFLIRYKSNNSNITKVIEEKSLSASLPKIIIWLIISSFSLYYGASLLVSSSVILATSLGVSEAVISVSAIAVGTSIPELATSIVAIANKEKGISIGNIIGSNIFNIGSVLGLTSIIKPIHIYDLNILNRDILVMLLFTFLILIFSKLPKKNIINKIKGLTFITFYSMYIIYIYIY
tara:strand:- start:268 stop:1212 length:945 start_codon:yes stop_codon:yes gene_type:complete